LAAADIDRLIEEGLTRYGTGDLDGAIAAWEQVLAIEPDHQQAHSYVDYVRSHYEQLANGAAKDKSGPLPALPGQSSAPTESVDEGWGDDSEEEGEEATKDASDVIAARRAREAEQETDEAKTQEQRKEPEQVHDGDVIELEPEEPTRDHEFDTATREYKGPGTFQVEEATGTFSGEGTPAGMRFEQPTEVRPRDLGFVQSKADADRAPPVPIEVKDLPSNPPPIGAAATVELDAAGGAALADAAGAVKPRDTKDMPSDGRRPAKPSTPPPATPPLESLPAPAPTNEADPTAVSQAELVLQNAPTRELDRARTGDPAPAPGAATDVGAPTRDLGIRPKPRAPTNDDMPTREADVRAFREQRAQRERRKGSEATSPDLAPQLDPIDARAQQILDDVDAGAPAEEPIEERTRRRIGALCERAMAWNLAEDFDSAVTAVDLALSEDPGSALAQKLLHRNRETILTVFQNYLGPHERQPHLVRQLQELSNEAINPRAAFLLSRIDGILTIEEILDVSGMPRLEAYRYLCQLFLRGVLR
jgi:hypothetical protein